MFKLKDRVIVRNEPLLKGRIVYIEDCEDNDGIDEDGKPIIRHIQYCHVSLVDHTNLIYKDCELVLDERDVSKNLVVEKDKEYVGYVALRCPTCKGFITRYLPPIHFEYKDFGCCKYCGQRIKVG